MALSDIDSNAPVPSAITTPLVVISVIFPLLSAVAIYLRYVARRKAHQPFYVDDFWIVASWILAFPISVLVWVFASLSGINYYKVDPLSGTSYSLELIFLSSCLIQFPLSTVKISILLFYKRIFSTRIFRTCIWIAIGTVAVWGILFFSLVLTQVDPISQSWKGGRLRYDSTALGLAQVGSSIGLDVVVLCFPLPVISRLHMDAKRKIALALIFWLGAFCCVAAIVRTVLLDQSIRAVISSQNNIFLQSKQYIFMIIEPNTSIIAACLPCYGTLLPGNRAPEFLVRSVRSLISLGSGRSKNSSREGSNLKNVSATESQVELQSTQQGAHCVGGEFGHEIQVSTVEPKSGIRVTKGVTVRRQ